MGGPRFPFQRVERQLRFGRNRDRIDVARYELRQREPMVLLAVADEAPGMPQQHVEQRDGQRGRMPGQPVVPSLGRKRQHFAEQRIRLLAPAVEKLDVAPDLRDLVSVHGKYDTTALSDLVPEVLHPVLLDQFLRGAASRRPSSRRAQSSQFAALSGSRSNTSSIRMDGSFAAPRI